MEEGGEGFVDVEVVGVEEGLDGLAGLLDEGGVLGVVGGALEVAFAGEVGVEERGGGGVVGGGVEAEEDEVVIVLVERLSTSILLLGLLHVFRTYYSHHLLHEPLILAFTGRLRAFILTLHRSFELVQNRFLVFLDLSLNLNFVKNLASLQIAAQVSH